MNIEAAEKLFSDKKYGNNSKFRDQSRNEVYCRTCFVDGGVILLVKLDEFEMLENSDLECDCCKAMSDPSSRIFKKTGK